MVKWTIVALTSLYLALTAIASAAPRDKKAEKRANTKLLRWFLLSLDQSQIDSLNGGQKDSPKREKMLELGDQIAQKLPASSRNKFLDSLEKYDSSLKKKLPVKEVYKQYQQMRFATYKHFKVVRIPSQNPSISLGAQVYKAHCSMCHGVSGRGDGVLTQNTKFPMQPGPGDLKMLGENGFRSPVSYHNTLLLGSPGTSMPSFAKRLSNHEAWSVAFYLVSDRFWGANNGTAGESKHVVLGYEKVPAKFQSLEFLATRSDTDIRFELEEIGAQGIKKQINALRNMELQKLSVPRKTLSR